MQPGGSSPEEPALNPERGLARVLHNRELFQRILNSFEESEGQTAVAIQTAIVEGDLQQARSLAHALRGVAGNIGAIRLHKKLAELGASLRAEERDAALTLSAAVVDEMRATLGAIAAWKVEGKGA